MAIRFYRANGPYGCLSNFSPHPIHLKGKVWKTSEHYFQAMKFEGTGHEEAVRRAPSPVIAKRRGGDSGTLGKGGRIMRAGRTASRS